MPCLASPPDIHLPLALDWLYPLITDTIQWTTLSFSPKTSASGGDLYFHLGALGHLFPTRPVPFGLHNQFGALLPHQPEGLGGCRKILQQHCLPTGFHQRGGNVRQGVWPFHHMGEPVSGQGLHCGGSGYATDHLGLQWTWLALCLGAAQQGHLPWTTPQGGVLEHPARRGHWQCHLWNGQPARGLPTPELRFAGHLPSRAEWCEAPMIASPPKSLARGAHLLGGEPIYLKVDIPQSVAEGQELKALPYGIFPSILMASPIKAPVQKVEKEVSMTIEVRELLSWAVLDTSGHASRKSTPKRLNPMVILTPPPYKLGNISGPVDTSSQVSTLDDAEMGEAFLEEIPTAPLPTAETPGLSGSAPLTDAGLLWEEANKALGELLATKSSIDTCCQKLVWELGMTFCRNEPETTESIKEAKAICNTTIKESKATCACSM